MAQINGKSRFLEAKVLDHVLRNVTYTPPATVYLALFTVMPADDGTGGTEVAGNAYARQAVTFAAAVQGTPSSAKNSAQVTFPVATPAGWGTLVGFGVYDALTNGNLLYGQTMSSTVLNLNDQFITLINNLTVTEA